MADSPAIITSFGAPDPDECPMTTIEQVAMYNRLVSSEIQGDYIIYITGSSTPAVEDQDKIWQREDAQGRPIGTYKYYSGHWVRVYTHPIGFTGYFTGDPTALFDGTGLGIIDTDWYGWALCNGNNGTPNLSDKFIINARVDNVGISGYSSGWQTNAGGIAAKTGGTSTVTLDSTTTYRPAVPALNAGKWEADGNAGNASSGNLYGTIQPGNTTQLAAGDAGNLTPAAIPILPSFVAEAPIMFVGYA